jgi:hypothetical protein
LQARIDAQFFRHIIPLQQIDPAQCRGESPLIAGADTDESFIELVVTGLDDGVLRGVNCKELLLPAGLSPALSQVIEPEVHYGV